ncbi:MAG: hypothetical protein R2822_21550 [Spirosomataceae bacterium]
MKYWILVTLVALGLSSCLKDVQSEAEKKYAENEIEIQNYISQSKLPFEKSASGLYYYFSTKNPNGAKPNVGDEISIHYKLFKMSGGVFDSTDRSKISLFHMVMQSILSFWVWTKVLPI